MTNITNWYEWPSNYSNGSEVNGIGSFYQYVSSISSDWFANVFVLLIFIMVFGFSLVAGSRKALATASFVSFIFAAYFSFLGMIHWAIPSILIVASIIGAIGSKSEGY